MDTFGPQHSAAVIAPRLSGIVADRQAIGIGLGLLAYSLLAWQDATIKWLVTALPVWQILFARSAIVTLGCLWAGRGALVRHAIRTPTAGLLLRRGAITLAAWSCYFTAAKALPLAQLVTLYFTAPIIVTLLAAPLLGERVGPVRWAAVGSGFVGTLLSVNPLGVSLSLATVLVLVAAALWAYGVILTRQIARREPSLVQMFYTNSFFLVATGVGAALTWHPLNLFQAGFLVQVGILGGLGQLSLFEAARRAPASLTAPLEYTALVWAFLLGFAIWGDVPHYRVIIGAGLILCAGFALLSMERRRGRATVKRGRQTAPAQPPVSPA